MTTDKLFSHKKFKFLVIEDDRAEQKVMELALTHVFNCEVYLASFGTEGIEIASRHLLDLIFINVGLPDMDGVKVAEIIRQEESRNKYTLIIANSANPSEEQRCLKAGIAAFLVKPFSISQLQEIIKKFALLGGKMT
jgi:CheY-like chemotaxis protein